MATKYDPEKTPALIRKLREEHGMTQEQIAKRLKVSRTTISEWKDLYPEVTDALGEKVISTQGKYDARHHPLVVAYLRYTGMDDKAICVDLNISDSTFDEWQKKYPEFREACGKNRKELGALFVKELQRRILEPFYVTEEEIRYQPVRNPRWKEGNGEPKEIEVFVGRVVRKKQVPPQIADFERGLRVLFPERFAKAGKGEAEQAPVKPPQPKSERELEIEKMVSGFSEKHLYMIDRLKRERRDLYDAFFQTGDLQPVLAYFNIKPNVNTVQ